MPERDETFSKLLKKLSVLKTDEWKTETSWTGQAYSTQAIEGFSVYVCKKDTSDTPEFYINVDDNKKRMVTAIYNNPRLQESIRTLYESISKKVEGDKRPSSERFKEALESD